MPGEQGHVTASPSWNITDSAKKKGNELLNITYKVRKSHFWEVMFWVGSYII